MNLLCFSPCLDPNIVRHGNKDVKYFACYALAQMVCFNSRNSVLIPSVSAICKLIYAALLYLARALYVHCCEFKTARAVGSYGARSCPFCFLYSLSLCRGMHCQRKMIFSWRRLSAAWFLYLSSDDWSSDDWCQRDCICQWLQTPGFLTLWWWCSASIWVLLKS